MNKVIEKKNNEHNDMKLFNYNSIENSIKCPLSKRFQSNINLIKEMNRDSNKPYFKINNYKIKKLTKLKQNRCRYEYYYNNLKNNESEIINMSEYSNLEAYSNVSIDQYNKIEDDLVSLNSFKSIDTINTSFEDNSVSSFYNTDNLEINEDKLHVPTEPLKLTSSNDKYRFLNEEKINEYIKEKQIALKLSIDILKNIDNYPIPEDRNKKIEVAWCQKCSKLIALKLTLCDLCEQNFCRDHREAHECKSTSNRGRAMSFKSRLVDGKNAFKERLKKVKAAAN